MNLKQKIHAGQTLFTAWSSIPDPITVGIVASTSFDAVTLDMQHGGHSDESVMVQSGRSCRMDRMPSCGFRLGGLTWPRGRWISALRR
jgi:4-hydroxy-2-oxoheptanedioate aldolase